MFQCFNISTLHLPLPPVHLSGFPCPSHSEEWSPGASVAFRQHVADGGVDVHELLLPRCRFILLFHLVQRYFDFTISRFNFVDFCHDSAISSKLDGAHCSKSSRFYNVSIFQRFRSTFGRFMPEERFNISISQLFNIPSLYTLHSKLFPPF